MLWKFAVALVISVVLHVIVKQLARFMPAEREVDLSEVPHEMIARAGVRANRIGTLSALLVFMLLVPLWIAVGYWLDATLRPAVAADELVAIPLHVGRWMRAMIASHALAGLAALWITRVWIGNTYYLSMAAGNQLYAFSASRFFYWAIVWALPFCIEYELHAIGSYTLFTRAALVESDTSLWPARQRPWSSLAAIELVKPYREAREDLLRTPECRLRFAGGHQWTDKPWLLPFHPRGATVAWEDACAFAAQCSQQPITVVRRIE